MAKIKIHTKVENGITKHNYQIREAIRKFEGQHLTIVLYKSEKKRSNEQNSFYWGVIVPIMKQGLLDCGYRMTIDEVHEYIKGKFCITEKVNEETGEIISFAGSTTDLSTTDFMAMFEEIKQFAAEFLNTEIPDPGEKLKI